MQKKDRVKHVKSDTSKKNLQSKYRSEDDWYQKLNNGIVESVSKTGKTAVVFWHDENGNYFTWGRYAIGNLVTIEESA